jgi:hypothetical protein
MVLEHLPKSGKGAEHRNRFPIRNRRKILILLLAAMGITVSSACLWFQGTFLSNDGVVQETDGNFAYQLSAEQTELINRRGYPEAFIILFYEEDSPDGALKDVRQEVWDYYTAGESYTFLNGELSNLENLDGSAPGSLAALPYVPEQFSAGMSLEDVIESAGLEDFIEVPLDKEFLEGGNLYYGDSLAFGLMDGQLRYLEGLALIEE